MRRLSNLRASFLNFLVLLLCTQPVCSQEPPCTTRKVPVYFRDAQSLSLQNISINDLDAKVHGQPVKMISLASDLRPHRVVLILDASGSMGISVHEPPSWNLELSLAQHFFEMNRQRSRVALLFFNDRVNEVVDFSQGNSAVADRLWQVAQDREYRKNRVKGKTALRDAIFEGVELLDHPTSADAVYVLTDGGDNASIHSTSDLLQRLAVTSVRVFAILVYQDRGASSRPPEEVSGPNELSDIAQKSGGEILTAAMWSGTGVALSANAETKVKSEETLNRLYQTILQDSLLEVELPFLIVKNERWELKLSNTARRQWKGAQITYPTILVSCSAEVFGSGRN